MTPYLRLEAELRRLKDDVAAAMQDAPSLARTNLQTCYEHLGQAALAVEMAQVLAALQDKNPKK